MKAPNLPSFSESCPFPQEGQRRAIGAVLARRENVRAQELVEAVEHLPGAQILDLAERRREIAPEIGKQVLPVDLRVGDQVELFFERSGEIVFDVARKEGFEKRGDEPTLVLRDQPLLLQPDIVAVAQHRQRRGVGRGTSDAELLHSLDQRRFGVARRRLGEVLRRVDALLGQGLARIHRRQLRPILVLLVVAALLVEREESGKTHNLAAGAKFEPALARFGEDFDRGALELGALHLAGDGARPDRARRALPARARGGAPRPWGGGSCRWGG